MYNGGPCELPFALKRRVFSVINTHSFSGKIPKSLFIQHFASTEGLGVSGGRKT